MKKVEDMTFEELVAWAEGHILKELIQGKFHYAVFTVCSIAAQWHAAQDKINKQK